MRITISQDGGIAYFPGLSEPTVIEGDDLAQKDNAKLTSLVNTAGFFELPDRHASASRAVDARQYTLTIQEGKRKRTLRIPEPITDDKLRALVEFVQAKANAKRRSSK